MSYRLTVNEQTFEVSFEHQTKYGSKPHFRKGNISALTICRVEQVGTKFSRYGVSMCSEAHAPKPTFAVQVALQEMPPAIAMMEFLVILLPPGKPAPDESPEVKALRADLKALEKREINGRKIGSPTELIERMRQSEWQARVEQLPDQYSKRQGRLKSLDKALGRSTRLRKIKVPFLEAYLALDKPVVKRPQFKLSEGAIEERIAAGHSNLPQEEAVRRTEAKLERERKDLATRAGSNS